MLKDYYQDYNAVDALFVHSARRRMANSVMTFVVLGVIIIVFAFDRSVPGWLLWVLAACDLVAVVFAIHRLGDYFTAKDRAERNHEAEHRSAEEDGG